MFKESSLYKLETLNELPVGSFQCLNINGDHCVMRHESISERLQSLAKELMMGLAMNRVSHCKQHKHNRYSDSILLHLLHSYKHTQTDKQANACGLVVPYFWWRFIRPSRVPRNSDLSPHLHPAPLLLLELLLL